MGAAVEAGTGVMEADGTAAGALVADGTAMGTAAATAMVAVTVMVGTPGSAGTVIKPGT